MTGRQTFMLLFLHVLGGNTWVLSTFLCHTSLFMEEWISFLIQGAVLSSLFLWKIQSPEEVGHILNSYSTSSSLTMFAASKFQVPLDYTGRRWLILSNTLKVEEMAWWLRAFDMQTWRPNSVSIRSGCVGVYNSSTELPGINLALGSLRDPV